VKAFSLAKDFQASFLFGLSKFKEANGYLQDFHYSKNVLQPLFKREVGWGGRSVLSNYKHLLNSNTFDTRLYNFILIVRLRILFYLLIHN
jgi:hypothetical protein